MFRSKCLQVAFLSSAAALISSFSTTAVAQYYGNTTGTFFPFTEFFCTDDKNFAFTNVLLHCQAGGGDCPADAPSATGIATITAAGQTPAQDGYWFCGILDEGVDEGDGTPFLVNKAAYFKGSIAHKGVDYDCTAGVGCEFFQHYLNFGEANPAGGIIDDAFDQVDGTLTLTQEFDPPAGLGEPTGFCGLEIPRLGDNGSPSLIDLNDPLDNSGAEELCDCRLIVQVDGEGDPIPGEREVLEVLPPCALRAGLSDIKNTGPGGTATIHEVFPGGGLLSPGQLLAWSYGPGAQGQQVAGPLETQNCHDKFDGTPICDDKKTRFQGELNAQPAVQVTVIYRPNTQNNNTLNVSGENAVKIYVLGEPGFDPADVDPNTICVQGDTCYLPGGTGVVPSVIKIFDADKIDPPDFDLRVIEEDIASFFIGDIQDGDTRTVTVHGWFNKTPGGDATCLDENNEVLTEVCGTFIGFDEVIINGTGN